MLIGESVKNVITRLKLDVLICTVERDDEAHIVNGDFVFAAKDLISFIASPKNAAEFFKKIGYKGRSIKNALVIGAGDTTHYLCDMLKKSGISLKVVDKSKERCEELASQHEEVTVICGDESDHELLCEEGIETADAVLSLTESDEGNIFLSISAKNFSRGKIIAKINRPEYDDIIKHLDIDTAIYPKSITSDMIVRYVRAMENTLGSNVETMYTFIKGKVEATEFIINEDSPIIDIPLSRLAQRLKENVLVAAILRDGAVIIPHGQDMIKSGDAVVIVSKILGLNDISEIIR